MELGVMTNVYRFERGGKTSKSYIQQLNSCAQAGFRVVDLSATNSIRNRNDDLATDDWEAKIDALGNHAAGLGIRFSQSHAPFNGNIMLRGKQPDSDYVAMFREMSRRTVIAASRLGVRWVVVHPLTDTVNTEYDNSIQLQTNPEFYCEMVELAAKLGTGIAFENMSEPGEHCDPRRRYGSATDDLIAILDSFAGAPVGVCWDVGHGRITYTGQPRQLRRLGSRLKATHVHDNRGQRDSHLIPFVGGNIKWETIMPVLREIGYEGDFILETHKFMGDIPEALRPAAGRLMHQFGDYCLDMYNNA